MSSGQFILAEPKPLEKDSDGDPAFGDISYNSVLEMLMYLAGHTRHDIAYAVNCGARHISAQKLGIKKNWLISESHS